MELSGYFSVLLGINYLSLSQIRLQFWTSMGTLASAVAALVLLAIMLHQTRSQKRIAGCQFVLDFTKEYDSHEMKDHRARLARVLLLGEGGHFETKQDELRAVRERAPSVLRYFEELGAVLDQGLAPVHFIWATNAPRIWNYYECLKLDSRFRGLGLGAKLGSHLCQKLRQWDITHCHVLLRSGDEAAGFYQKIGFKRQSLLVDYFSDGRDALILFKKLPSC